MKIRILKGTTALHGRAVAEGEIIDVDEATYRNLAEFKLAELVIEPTDLSVAYRTTSVPPEEITRRVVTKESKPKK